MADSLVTAELTIGQIIALSRRLGEKNLEMHKGTWNKVINNIHLIFIFSDCS
jgi:phosphoglycerate dehydrogenase-like enzyme